MSTTAHSQTRARSWALPCRHALKHRLRPSFTPGHHWRRLPASAPGPTTPPAQGHPFGRASHDHLDATWSLGKSTALFHCSSQRHSPWAQAPVAPAARLQDPPAPVPSICHLARAPEPPPPPIQAQGYTQCIFPPPASQGDGEPFPVLPWLLLEHSGETVAVPGLWSSISPFPPQDVPADGCHRLVGAATPRGAPPLLGLSLAL